MSGSIEKCPLCGQQDADQVWSVSYEEVWGGLKAQWNATFPEDLRRPYDEVGNASLYRCRQCALEYFSPLLPGDARFYNIISQNPKYYVQERWEFRKVLETLSSTDSVLDLGSGRGAFVEQARGHAGFVVGCDQNENENGEHRETTILRENFDDVARANAARFDVVTAFHVLEHVPSTSIICEPARIALKPGGRLFISAPDRDRTLRDDFEALDCPPHHLSRWGKGQFEALGLHHSFELLSIEFEPYIDRRGARRLVPTALLDRVGLLYHRRLGRTIQPPPGGTLISLTLDGPVGWQSLRSTDASDEFRSQIGRNRDMRFVYSWHFPWCARSRNIRNYLAHRCAP